MLNSKTKLCVEVLVALASAPPGVLVTTQTLSDRLSVSISHLESIIRALREAGLVRSIRGPGGGYFISREPHSISIWDVVEGVGEAAPPVGQAARLQGPTAGLEAALASAFRSYLSARTIGEMATVDERLAQVCPPVQSGFKLGPMPERIQPRAPNSVFELSSYLDLAPA